MERLSFPLSLSAFIQISGPCRCLPTYNYFAMRGPVFTQSWLEVHHCNSVTPKSVLQFVFQCRFVFEGRVLLFRNKRNRYWTFECVRELVCISDYDEKIK